MLTKQDIKEGMRLLREMHRSLFASVEAKQVAGALEVYEDRGEYDGSYYSAVECLKQAEYEIDEQEYAS